MLRFLRNSNPYEAEFCDGCASVCEHRCAADAVRRQVEERALRNYGWRLA